MMKKVKRFGDFKVMISNLSVIPLIKLSFGLDKSHQHSSGVSFYLLKPLASIYFGYLIFN